MSQQTAEGKTLKPNERIEYIDILRVLSMFSVVFLHTVAGSLRGNFGSAAWHFSNIFTSIMSTSVPIFFMISGAMLLSSEKTASLEVTFKKRMPKVLVPFVIWSISAVAYYAIMGYTSSGSIDWKMVITKLRNFPSQPTTTHLWFMYALIPLYMLSPLLKRLVDSLSENLVKYLLAIWLVFSSLLPTAVQFLPQRYQSLLTLNASYNLNFLGGYLGYFIIGYYLMNYRKRLSKRLLTGVVILDTIIIVIGTWWKTYGLGAYSELFKSYSKIFIVVLSIAVFLLIKEMMRDRQLSAAAFNGLQVLSSMSFGVYLVHNLIVNFIAGRIDLTSAAPIQSLVLGYFIVLFFSLICIFALASCKLTCYAFTGVTYKNACDTFNLQYIFKRLIKKSSH